MDITRRQITKIARIVSRFTVRTLKESGVGTAEFDLIHAVRKHPGITQAELREELKLDKGAAARRTANLESKGYLIRKDNPEDGRSKLIFATEKSGELKNSKASVEANFYEWLLSELSESERQSFTKVLDKIYLKAKCEAKNDFSLIGALVEKSGDRDKEDEE